MSYRVNTSIYCMFLALKLGSPSSAPTKAGHTPFCPPRTADPLHATITMSVHVWANTSQNSFCLSAFGGCGSFKNTLVITENSFSNWENSKHWLHHPTCLSCSPPDTASSLNMVFSSHFHPLLCARSFVFMSGTTTLLREFLKGNDSHRTHTTE